MLGTRRALKSTYPDVDFRAYVAFALEHFGCGVRGRTAPSGQQIVGTVEIREPKVGDFDFHV